MIDEAKSLEIQEKFKKGFISDKSACGPASTDFHLDLLAPIRGHQGQDSI